MTRSCSLCGSNGHNSRTCDQSTAAARGGSGGGGGGGEFMLFGVRVKVDPLRKTVSMNDLSNYETPKNSNALPVITNESSTTTEKAVEDTDIGGGGGGGYVSADEALHHQHTGGRERKRGTPWTEEEHRLFLFGLQKVGKGDWKGISRNFVKSRTPTQVASHAQKYFIRKNNLNRRRRRSSLFDITTDSVTGESMDEGKIVKESSVPSSVEITPVATAFLPAAQPQYSPNTTTTTATTYTTVNSGYQASHHQQQQLPSPTSILYYSLPYPARAPFPESTTNHPDELNIGYYNESTAAAAAGAPQLSLRLSLGQSSTSSMRYSDSISVV